VKKNLFEMGAKIEAGWEADNKTRPAEDNAREILPPDKHRLTLHKEKRRGKTVTVVAPFHLAETEAKILLKRLKKKLGVGGTLKKTAMEFQGDIGDTLRNELEAMRYRFRA